MIVGHDVLRRVLTLKGYLIARSPLYVGSGKVLHVGVPTDLTFVRTRSINGREQPYIPGSSLKGVLRSTSEAIVRSLGLSKVRACDPLKEPCITSEDKDKVEEIAEREKLLAFLDNKLCITCKIYGSTVYHSHIRIDDCIAERYSFHIKPGVAIGRDSGAVAKGPYHIEYVTAGSRFSFRLTCTNLPNCFIGLVASSLDLINKGVIPIGGQKTRGFGRAEVLLDRIEVLPAVDYDGKELKPIDPVKDVSVALPALESPSKDEKAIREFTENVLSSFIKAWEDYIRR